MVWSMDGTAGDEREDVSGPGDEGATTPEGCLGAYAAWLTRKGLDAWEVETLVEQRAAALSPPVPEEKAREIAVRAGRANLDEFCHTSEVHCTDLGNARRLARRHGTDMRYCHDWQQWLVWDKKRWVRDGGQAITRRVMETLGAMHREAEIQRDEELKRHATRSESEPRIRAMISLARNLPGIGLSSGGLDAGLWLLNCENGTLDLKTGRLLPHRREDLITRMAPVAYDPEAPCPLWERFLDTVTGGSGELRAFLQKAAGYALTGDTREQVLFLLYGTGANGKSTFLETLRRLLGDYARQTDFTTFLARRSEGIRNDIARLQGARFVSAVEAERGQNLAEVLVKQLTGGDTVNARYLYQEFVEFACTFTLFLATNHKPAIKGNDYALWRRMRLVPFTVTIPQEKRYRDLPARLRGELPGILRWAVEGCLAWQNEGLGEPQAVLEATHDYRMQMDPVGAFLGDRCLRKADAKACGPEVCRAYVAWCEASGETALGRRALREALKERGYRYERGTGGAWFWKGFGLKG